METAVKLILSLAGVMSALLFVMMGVDKHRARRGGQRIPEKRLFLVAFLFGAFGGWIGMYTFRHKTKHWYFKWGFPLICLVQSALIVLVFGR